MSREPSSEWDRQYEAGDWSYLWSEEQRPRYGVIASWCHNSITQPYTLLDVGCGEGVLLRYFPQGELKRYVGIDWSKTAIHRATNEYEEASGVEFALICAEEYAQECKERFSVIVINEMLYCCPDPLGVFQAYARLVDKKGYLILSVCDAHVALWQLVERIHHQWLRNSWHVCERLSGKAWGLSVFQPAVD